MKELDLTQGSVPKVLLRFAMPFLIANVLQALYGGADLFVVGQYDDAASVAGVAIGSQVMQTITGIILGLTTGTTILIAMGTGAKDDRKVAATIGTSVYFFTVTGIILTLVMVLFHRPIAALMHTPEEAMADTLHYILICSAGIPFIMGYNVVCGILRGLGDSKSPLYFVGLACIINIGADFLLVGGFGMRAAGAAIATVLSQGISFLTALWFLHRRGFHFEFTRRDIRFHKDLSRRIVTLGAPIALQDALINVSFLIHRQPDGCHRFGFAGRGRENHHLRHASAHGYGCGSGHHDGSKLRCGTDSAHEPLPVFRHRHLAGIRRVGMRVLTVPARNADRHFHERPRRDRDGSRIPARIQHRLRDGELRVLHQLLLQRAGQLVVPHDTQHDCHLPVPHPPLLPVR